VGYDAGYFDSQIVQRNLLISIAKSKAMLPGFRRKADDKCVLRAIPQRPVLISYRCFRTSYKSYLQGSIIQESFCVTGQNSAVLNAKKSRHLLNCLTLKMKTFLRNVR